MILKLTNLQGFSVLVNSRHIISTQPMVKGPGRVEFTQINVAGPHSITNPTVDVKETPEKILEFFKSRNYEIPS